MARERLPASDVDHGDLAVHSISAGPPGNSGSAPRAESEDRADIVLRAGRLGFSRARVATALGVSRDELLRIEQRND